MRFIAPRIPAATPVAIMRPQDGQRETGSAGGPERPGARARRELVGAEILDVPADPDRVARAALERLAGLHDELAPAGQLDLRVHLLLVRADEHDCPRPDVHHRLREVDPDRRPARDAAAPGARCALPDGRRREVGGDARGDLRAVAYPLPVLKAAREAAGRAAVAVDQNRGEAREAAGVRERDAP